MEKNLSFEQVINGKWVPDYPYDGNGPGVRVFASNPDVDINDEESRNDGVLFTMDTIWDEYLPLTHNLDGDETAIKLYSVLRHSNEMYLLLKSMDDERAKQLIEKIDNSKEFPLI